MTILKKRKKIIPVLCVVFAVLIAILTFGLLFPKKSNVSASAAGFEDEDFNHYDISIELVGYSPTDTYSLTFSTSSEYSYLQPQTYAVDHGVDLCDMLDFMGYFDNTDKYSDIYVSLTFMRLFYTGDYDFFISNYSALFEGANTAFDATGRALYLTWEDFIPPMSIKAVSKATLSGAGYNGAPVSVRSLVLRFRTSYFINLKSLYENHQESYYLFMYSKRAFVNFDTAYNQGYDAGQEYGYNEGYTAGQTYGYNIGQNEGYARGLNQQNSFTGLLSAVFDVPVQTFFGILNFEILGVNLSSFVLGFFTISLVIFLIRKFL